MRVRITIGSLAAALLISACSSGPQAAVPTPAVQTPSPAPTGGLATAPGGVTMPTTPAMPGLPTATPQPPKPTFTVQRGEVVDEVMLSGQVVAVQQGLAFAQDGVLERITVARGAAVEPGQLLAELDLGDLPNQLKQAKTVYDQDRVALARAIQAGQTEVQRAQVDVDEAKARLEELREPATPDKVAAVRSEVQQAEANLETVKNNASQAKNLAHQDMVYAVIDLDTARQRLAETIERAQNPDTSGLSRAATLEKIEQGRKDVEAAQQNVRLAEEKVNRMTIAFDTARNNEVAAVKTAEATVAVAQANLEKLLAGPTRFEVAEAERAVQIATIALNAAKLSAQPDPSLTKQVASSQLDVQRIEQQIDDRRLYAPFGGEISAIEIGPGSLVRAGAPVIFVLDPGRREVRTDGTAVDGSEKLTLGQPVELTFGSLAGQTIEGAIRELPASDGGAAAVTPVRGGIFRIDFDAQGQEIQIGEPVEIKAILGRKENALWLPPEAVRINRDRNYVMIKEGERERRVEVQVGLITAERIEIIAGVKEGDVVLGEASPTR